MLTLVIFRLGNRINEPNTECVYFPKINKRPKLVVFFAYDVKPDVARLYMYILGLYCKYVFSMDRGDGYTNVIPSRTINSKTSFTAMCSYFNTTFRLINFPRPGKPFVFISASGIRHDLAVHV